MSKKKKNRNSNMGVNVSPKPIADGGNEQIVGELFAEHVAKEEEEDITVVVSASVVPASLLESAETDNNEMSIEELRNEIASQIAQLEANDMYKSLLDVIARNSQLRAEALAKIEAVRDRIVYANQYIKKFTDKFIKELLKDDWFDKYYDAVCLFERAHDSSESMEWCGAMRDVLDESVNDKEKSLPRIRVQLNRRLPNSVFTLSVKTPYLRLKNDLFKEIKVDAVNQSKSFYTWLKNIENLSMLLHNYWLELHTSSLERCTCLKCEGLNLETVLTVSLSEYVASYIDENVVDSNDKMFYNSILNDINLFIEKLDEIEAYHNKQYEENGALVKYLTDKLLNDYHTKDLEAIYRIYDEIRLSVDLMVAKYGESNEAKEWCRLLKSLNEVIEEFLNLQNIYRTPEMVIGESHIDESVFEIENTPYNFFSFAKVASATEATAPELVERVASVSKYGFYLKESNDNIRIIRETVVSVYN